MPTINIDISNKIAKVTTPDAEIVCGNNDYTAKFSFDDEWSAYAAKTAVLRYSTPDGKRGQEVVFTGDSCSLPALYNLRCVNIGVVAGDIRTTTAAVIRCKPCITDGDSTHAAPPEDVYNQIIDLINNGALKGEKGEQGPKGEKGEQGPQGTVGPAGPGAEVFYIDLAGDYPNYTCPVAMADITAAYGAGKVLECRCKMGAYTATLPLFIPMPDADAWVFSGSGELEAMHFSAQTFTVAISSTGVKAENARLVIKSDIPTALPNPNTLTITSGSNSIVYDGGAEESIDIPAGEKGDKGEKGEPGADGKTPVKGTDYWTEADKTAIVADVIAALPVAEEASV